MSSGVLCHVCVVTDISEEHAMPEAAQSCERSGIVDKLSCDNIPQDISLQAYKICKLNVIFELEHARCLSNYMMHSPS